MPNSLVAYIYTFIFRKCIQISFTNDQYNRDSKNLCVDDKGVEKVFCLHLN